MMEQVKLPKLSLQQIEDYVLKHGGKCVNCGANLRRGSIRSYDHVDGIEVRGFKVAQWVYFHCGKCNLDSALWKVLQQIEAEERIKAQLEGRKFYE